MHIEERVEEKKRTEGAVYWFALYTMPRTEKRVKERLDARGWHTFLPLIPSVRTWSDRKKKVSIPLIPGFIFVECTEEEVFDALLVEGVLNVIRYMKRPAKVRSYEINNIRILLQEPSYMNLLDESDKILIGEGDWVEVVRGPFVGVQGRCVRSQGKCRLVVEIKALGSMIEVNVPLSFVELIHRKAKCEIAMAV